ncbi:hypothetical protein LAZ67_X002045 [Cordylochernes scorpioides]|uniref:Uncharacterized protein n=1 Tax=Cordylochernes scorpioides TaxID=51811 RepID=A0ABY6LTI9_9ARAC|nr:hypothetical protein LAZ67_X002045 [Cordylochernes scorpioides]
MEQVLGKSSVYQLIKMFGQVLIRLTSVDLVEYLAEEVFTIETNILKAFLIRKMLSRVFARGEPFRPTSVDPSYRVFCTGAERQPVAIAASTLLDQYYHNSSPCQGVSRHDCPVHPALYFQGPKQTHPQTAEEQVEELFNKLDPDSLHPLYEVERYELEEANLSRSDRVDVLVYVLRLCKEVDPHMNEEDKISYLMKGIAEKLYQALLPRDMHNTERFVTECRRIEALHCKRVTSTRYERLPNVASLSDHDDRADLSSMIRQIVREEVQGALGSTREEPKIATIENMVKEKIGRTLAPISKSRRSPPQKERPRLFFNTRYEAQTIRPHPETRYPKQGGRRDTNEWQTTEGKPICFHCGRPGHVVRYCRDRQRQNEERTAIEALPRTLVVKDNFRRLLGDPASRLAIPVRKLEDTSYFGANGKIVRPKGRCTLKLDSNGLKESFAFVVMEDCSHEVILGWDFLKLSRAIIDSADDTLFLEKCLFEDTPKNSSPLYSEFEYRIEPASIQLIEVAKKGWNLEILRRLPPPEQNNKKDVYPLPRIDDTLDCLRGAKFYSSMDLQSGYWQIDVEESDREKTAFITPDGLYEFKLPTGHLQLIPVPRAAFEKIGIDLLGRFPTSTCGTRWIIVCTDYLTKYAITKALPTSESMEVAKFLVEDVILKHGAPRELITDRGRNFTSLLIRDLNNHCRIIHRTTTAYHPQTNGLTERLNKTIADMLSMYVDVNQKDWDMILPFVTFAYNTSRQESTGFTPFFLAHGREAETPLDLLFPKLVPEDDDFIQTLGSRAEEARQLARLHSMRSQESNKLRYDAQHRNITYQPGDLVWIFIPVHKVGYSEKLMRLYFGPYKVTRKI